MYCANLKTSFVHWQNFEVKERKIKTYKQYNYNNKGELKKNTKEGYKYILDFWELSGGSSE